MASRAPTEEEAGVQWRSNIPGELLSHTEQPLADAQLWALPPAHRFSAPPEAQSPSARSISPQAPGSSRLGWAARCTECPWGIPGAGKCIPT